MRKTILLVAMPNSIHVVRWVKQFNDQGWDIHLFPSTGGVVIHPEMEGVTVHSPLFSWARKIRLTPPRKLTPSFLTKLADFLTRRLLDQTLKNFRSRRLSRVIRRIRPHLVHSLEMQAAGYLTLAAKKQLSSVFPAWLVTNWGSDIYLFGRMKQHKAKISEVLENCDYYSCECERDIKLARQFGFKGTTMPVFPNTGGFDLPGLEKEREKAPASSRKIVMLKGYQNWAGRALVALRALSRCEDILQGYAIYIYSASPDVEIGAELLADLTGINVRIIPNNTAHQDMMSLHAKARVSIGLSISDAISTSFLEAMVMGSFPIQSCTACVDEWIVHGVSGMIVPPEDPDIIELAIRSALSDDALVDAASVTNWQIAQERLCGKFLKQRVLAMYSSLLQES